MSPAHEKGFSNVFINQQQWYYVKIDKWKIDILKYIIIYRTSPESKITHIAKIKNFEKCLEGVNKNKWKLFLYDVKELKYPIELGKNKYSGRSQRYTSPYKFIRATNMDYI